MQVSKINNTNTPNFGGLFESKLVIFSPKQRVLKENLKDVLIKTCPIDNEGRSYIKLLEERYNKDIVMSRGVKARFLKIIFRDRITKELTDFETDFTDHSEKVFEQKLLNYFKGEDDKRNLKNTLKAFLICITAIAGILISLAGGIFLINDARSKNQVNNKENATLNISGADYYHNDLIDTYPKQD